MGKIRKLWEKTPNYQDLAIIVNGMLLIIHLCLLIMFVVMQCTFMTYVNVFSVITYLINFYWAKKSLKMFFTVAYVEILLQMILGVSAVGWDCGFQMYGFALILTIYYCDYLVRKIGLKTLHPRAISGIIVVIYLLLYTETHYFMAWDGIPSVRSRSALFSVNAMAVLIMIIIYMEDYQYIVTQTESRLRDAAEKDELTKMNNRRSMQKRINEIAEMEKSKDEIAIAILDIDDFKKVNDTYGHSAGDMILYEVASKIREQESDSILACRWGGEEFLLLAVGKTAYQDMVDTVDKIIQGVCQIRYMQEEECIKVTVTAGVSVWENGEKIDRKSVV